MRRSRTRVVQPAQLCPEGRGRIARGRRAAALRDSHIWMGADPGIRDGGRRGRDVELYTLGVVGMLAHLRSGRSPIHLTLSGFRLRWDLFSRILKVASLSSMQILVNHVALIAITAYVARFGVEALAGYGLASRLELLYFFSGTRVWRGYDDNGSCLRRCGSS